MNCLLYKPNVRREGSRGASLCRLCRWFLGEVPVAAGKSQVFGGRSSGCLWRVY